MLCLNGCEVFLCVNVLQDYKSNSKREDLRTERQAGIQESDKKQQNSPTGKSAQPVRFGWVTGVMVRVMHS